MSCIIYDPTAQDEASSVRGIGRYLQILHENLTDAKYSSQIRSVKKTSTFINPFFDIIHPPLINRRIAKRQIAVIHDLIPLKYPAHFPLGLRGRINVYNNRRALKHYDIVVTDSEASKKDIVQILKIDPKRIHIIYPCLPRTYQTAVRGTDYKLPESGYFVYAGDATWNKNLVTMALAIEEAHATLLVVGRVFTKAPTDHPWNQHLNDFLTIAHDNPHFIPTGYISDNDLRYIYRNALANLLLSHDEGFGFSYIEAGACGTGSVLADTPVFHEVSGEQALFVPAGDASAIATTLTLLMTENNLRTKAADQAHTRSEYFTSRRFAEAWKEII